MNINSYLYQMKNRKSYWLIDREKLLINIPVNHLHSKQAQGISRFDTSWISLVCSVFCEFLVNYTIL